MEKMLGGHIVVKVLEKENVTKAFCVPGESYLGVIDGLYEHSTIDLISTRHEGGASFMAEAYAKATGDVGVCMATRGPGATNLSIGLHTAMQDSTPLVALIGQVERPFLGREAFQEVDFEAYFSHLCKKAIEIKDVNRIPELLHQAFYEARSGRPGPVVVSLPHDMLEDRAVYKPGKKPSVHLPEASEQTIQEAIAKVQQAERPFIIAGGGVIASKAQEELSLLAEHLQIPVVSAFRRFNIMDNYHENYAGWLGFGANPKLLQQIKVADVVLVLGTRLSQVSTMDYTLIGEDTEIIQVDIDAGPIGKSYPVDQAIVSDMKLFLQKALPLLENNTDDTRQAFVKKQREAYVTHSTVPAADGDTSYAEMNDVIANLMEMIPDNSVLTSDAGNFYGWLARYFKYTDKKQYIGPTSGAMGYGLPAALGAKVARPNDTVISFSGDGGFMMTAQELETAVRENIKVIAVVVNNNMFGTIRNHQEIHFPGRVISTPLTNPDFVEMAKLYGCNGATVTQNNQFPQAFEAALASDKTFVIEIRTSPDILSVAQAAKS